MYMVDELISYVEFLIWYPPSLKSNANCYLYPLVYPNFLYSSVIIYI